MAKCLKCGEDILFIPVGDNKTKPVNKEPRKMYVLFKGGIYKLIDCYESHQAVCPFRNDKYAKSGRG